MTQIGTANPPVAIATATPEPTTVEQSHVEQALNASQSAMDAIGTVTDIATYTLTILGVFIAILALWGVGMIIKAARDTAKQIANERLNAYIESEEFQALIQQRVDEGVRAHWQNRAMQMLEELTRNEGEEPPFKEKP